MNDFMYLYLKETKKDRMLYFFIVAFRKQGTIQRHSYKKLKSNNCEDLKWIRKNTVLYLALNTSQQWKM